MNAAWVIAMKDLRQLLRDKMACFFAFVFPLIMAVFCGTVFSGGSGKSDSGEAGRIAVLLVDEDDTAGSRKFAATLRESSELKITDMPTGGRDEAAAAVRTGKHPACVVVPKGFGATRENMFWGTGSRIELGVDPARRAEAGMLEGILTKYGFMELQESFQNPAKMRQQVSSSRESLNKSTTNPVTRRVFDRFFGDLDNFLVVLPQAQKQPEGGAVAAEESDEAAGGGMGGWQPMTIAKLEIARAASADGGEKKRGPRNSFSITFPQGVIWGVMGCALGFSIGLVLERSRGTMVRLRAAPLSQAQILGGKAMACFIATVFVEAMVLAVGMAFFGVRADSLPLLAVAILCVGVCFVGIMMLLSVLGRSESGGNSLGWGILLMLSMIGGGMIPLFFMPGWMQSLSIISPIRWSVLAIEGAVWRGFTPLEMVKPCAILVAIGVAGFVVGSRVVGKTEG